MKKLLLVSIVMIAVSGFAYAQTPETVKARKEAARNGTTAPAITTVDNKTAADSKLKAKKVETDLTKPAVTADISNAEKPVVTTEVKLIDKKTTAKPAVSKTKGN